MVFILTPVILVAIETATVLASAAGKIDGNVLYNTGAIILTVEFLKLAVSLGSIYREDPNMSEIRQFSLKQFALFSVPGLIYCVNNNLFLWIVTQISPSIFQILLNLRIVVSAVLFRCLLGRQLSTWQWLSTVTLTIGASLAQVSGLTSNTTGFSFFGLMLTLLYTLLSTVAGVYSEVLLKNDKLSLHGANSALYTWGVIFNGAMLVIQSQQSSGGFFRGWDYGITWVTLSLFVMSGLMISRILRQFDTIVKIMCVSFSNLLVYIFELLFLAKTLDPLFIPAFILVAGSTYVYNTSGEAQPHAKSESEPKLPEGAPATDRALWQAGVRPTDSNHDSDVESQTRARVRREGGGGTPLGSDSDDGAEAWSSLLAGDRPTTGH